MGRRYDDQMMLIDRSAVCDELRETADDLGMTHAELLREIVANALPGLRKRAAAARREAKRRRGASLARREAAERGEQEAVDPASV